jgi:transposase-like protein
MPLYTRTEYDAFCVGEFRQVQSYCPRRHTYVTDYAAPIVAPTVDTPHTGDEQLNPERLVYERHELRTAHGELRKPRASNTEAERARLAIHDLLEERAMSTVEIAAHFGVTERRVFDWLRFDKRFRKAGRAFSGKALTTLWTLRREG